MGDYSKFNIIYCLQKWMDSVPGQTFLNYAYSWGASVVILGTLFKLTHLPGANIMLFAGMGTEVLVFFLSAFDRPFDKTADGRDIPTHVTDEYLETGVVRYEKEKESVGKKPIAAPTDVATSAASPVASSAVSPVASSAASPAASSVASPVASSAASPVATSAASPASPVATSAASSVASSAASPVASSAAFDAVSNDQTAWVAGQQGVTPEMADAQNSYVEELKKLVETLEKVNEQSNRLTRDSEEMENLNRTLTGISKVYEMQLKGASQQIGTIDQINEQSRKMAQQIEQLNKIYTRMIEAMTVNMRAAAPQVKTEE